MERYRQEPWFFHIPPNAKPIDKGLEGNSKEIATSVTSMTAPVTMPVTMNQYIMCMVVIYSLGVVWTCYKLGFRDCILSLNSIPKLALKFR